MSHITCGINLPQIIVMYDNFEFILISTLAAALERIFKQLTAGKDGQEEKL